MTVVNLNRYRKRRKRTEKERLAAENRVRFGRSNPARGKERRERERDAAALDGKHLD